MTTSHGSYRGPSHHSMAGDSGYFHSGSRSAKSYSDTDFGKSYSLHSTYFFLKKEQLFVYIFFFFPF